MIAAAASFAIAVTLLLSGAAYVLERIAALYRLPRRGVWVIALASSCILPLAMMGQANRAPVIAAATPAAAVRTDGAAVASSLQISHYLSFGPSPSHWPARPALDRTLAIVWGSTSSGLLLIWAFAAVRLHRRAKGWTVVEMDGVEVSVADAFGPAVLGYVRPRIVVPSGVLQQPDSVRSIVLQHERSHIAAHDPALLLAALLVVFLAPWNLPLWWQLRRLRFAIEVDCDSRVLKHGVDAVAYGETLLSIGQRGGEVPLGIVALTEPASELERRVRIMMSGPIRYRKSLLGISLAFATSLVLAATSLSAPTTGGSSVLRKPPPGYAGAAPEKFVALIHDRYPTLATQKTDRMPVVLVLFNHDGTVAQTGTDGFQGSPRDYNATKALAEHFGLSPDSVGYVGAQTLEYPTQIVLVVYGETSARRVPFTSKVFADSRMIDLALAERFFPRALERGISAGEGIWVLFDHDGAVLRTGQESFEAAKLIPILESRYPGIKATEMTVTPVVDGKRPPASKATGGELQLYSVWLDAGSPLPGA